MQRYKNLTIIGTSHISIESINEIIDFVNNYKPEIIALELDPKRYLALTQGKKHDFRYIIKVGLKGYLINIIGAYI